MPKKNHSLRLCVDYHELNFLAFCHSYSVPKINECIDPLGKVIVSPTLHANSGCWQVEICTRDHKKTEFAGHHGLYQFEKMAFGLEKLRLRFEGK